MILIWNGKFVVYVDILEISFLYLLEKKLSVIYKDYFKRLVYLIVSLYFSFELSLEDIVAIIGCFARLRFW